MSALVDGYFNTTLSLDFHRVMCGKELGEGDDRTVYECKLRPDLVIKIETSGCSFQNVKEWEAWEAVKDDEKIARWLAPCESISPCGIVLMMKRTRGLAIKDYPEKLPSFLTDTHYSNYGLLDNEFVCHDYGRLKLLQRGSPLRMRKAQWWELT